MYGGQWSYESVIEAGNFATQTVTTVGYGNWETRALGSQVEAAQVLAMRGWSILFMLLGSVFYALFTGLFVAMLCPPSSGPQP
jgi:hypothetical protein